MLNRKINYNVKLFPQDGVVQLQHVYAENLEATDENITNRCNLTRLYRPPDGFTSYTDVEDLRKIEKKFKKEAFNELKDSQPSWPFDENWDELENAPLVKGHLYMHFHAAPECDADDQLTERGRVQVDGIMKFFRMSNYKNCKDKGGYIIVADDPRCQAAVGSRGRVTDGFIADEIQKIPHKYLVDGFPVDRLDPPHSDVIIPAGRSTAQADYWQMEYAFRKTCYRPRLPDKSYEHFVLPKNLIAYFVQRLMQFKPETFGRFRIRDGSHTHIIINRNGTPRVRTVGETNHWLNELYQHNLQCDGANDIGLDVPVDDEDSSVTLVQNDDEDMDVGDIDFESINSCVEQPSDVPSQRGFYSDLVGEGYFDDEDMDVDDIDFESINTCVEQPSDVPSQGGFHSDLVGEGYFDDMDYEDYLEEQDCLDEAELIY